MAKQAKDKAGDSARRGNGFDPEATKLYCSRVENLEAEIEVFRDDFKQQCEPLKEDIKQVVDEAEAAGIPKKEFKAALRRRKLERKQEEIRAKLDLMERANYDNIRLALGELRDTPLGDAAMRSAGAPESAHA